MSNYMTVAQVCELLQLAERTVYDLCRQGKLPGAAKVGGSWRVDEEKLREWLAEGGELADEDGDAARNKTGGA